MVLGVKNMAYILPLSGSLAGNVISRRKLFSLGQFTIKKEVWDWAWKNNVKMWKTANEDLYYFSQPALAFQTEEKALLFKLVWG